VGNPFVDGVRLGLARYSLRFVRWWSRVRTAGDRLGRQAGEVRLTSPRF